ncbi:MAG: GMC oxidoreductase, partial [Balneolaceae bacterium]|nr:GMC oxidoreductase [Balneolaceae bacterium]
GSASRPGWGRGIHMHGFGEELKKKLRDPGIWGMSLTGFGEILPNRENHAKLSESETDEWDMPLLEIHMEMRENEHNMRQDMADSAAEMLEAAGGKNVRPFYDEYQPGEGIHEMGTARMGRDPKSSVLNAHNQAHDVPNLFVTDGACMTSAANQNPSLTYMALTARAVDYAVEEMKRGNI